MRETHFIAPNVEDNEILKKVDFNLSGTAAMSNVALAIGTVVSKSGKACVIGGKVTRDTQAQGALRIDPLYMQSALGDVAAGAVRRLGTEGTVVDEAAVTLGAVSMVSIRPAYILQAGLRGHRQFLSKIAQKECKLRRPDMTARLGCHRAAKHRWGHS